MLGGAVARRYAQALYDIAIANKALDTLEEELKAIATIVEGDQGIQKILLHPQIAGSEKREVFKQLFEGRVSDTTINFLYLLVDRHREAYLSAIAAEFTALANAARNMVDAEVISARDLEDAQKADLAKVLNKLAGKEVSPVFTVDPALIGGLVVRIGDKVIDGSVKHKLEALKQRLMYKIS